MRRTKIVCTLGPATDSPAILRSVLHAGMNVARFNFSHGTHDEHLGRLDLLRSVARQEGCAVATMLDTQGPEIRLGCFTGGQAHLVTGKAFTLTTRKLLGNNSIGSVSFDGLPQAVSPGDEIFLDDGNIILKVESTVGDQVKCLIVEGGIISDRKKVNLPGIVVELPSLTEKDVRDIEFAIENEFDYIAASFVRSARDVLAIKKILEEYRAPIKIIAKIENRQGVENLDEILKVADGLMVARGDLGVEIPTEEVPLLQKRMISKCNAVGKPVITATQMLDSMIRNSRPTRAEASDVANAILDGTDAVMLSGETAVGKFPVEAVKTMHRIAITTENDKNYHQFVRLTDSTERVSVTEAIGQAVCSMASRLGASAIITPTESGFTARMISKYRPATDIIAVTPDKRVARELLLVWGVVPIVGDSAQDTDELLDDAVGTALARGLITNGDLVVITAGVPVGRPGSTNLLKVHTVGQVIARGIGIGKQSVTAAAFVALSAEASRDLPDGAILVARNTDRDYMDAIQRAAAVITESGGLTSHAAIVCLNLGKPVIVGASDITEVIRTGDEITIDSERGLVYRGHATVL